MPLTVAEFYRHKEETLGLELITAGASLDGRSIEAPSLSSPGLALTGFVSRFSGGRIQVFGQTEMEYLKSLPPADLTRVLEAFFTLEVPAVIVSKAQDVPPAMVRLALAAGVPVFRSQLKTGELYRRIQTFLEDRLAPTTTMHGSLADVYGVGLMFVGRSGIGKSECVLDLVERGHRLVADDLVYVSRRGNDVLIGRGNELQRHHMEIRGIGIIHIPALFGINAIRQQKRIEVVVQLEEWDDQVPYDRTGLAPEEIDVLGVKLPKVTVPLNPGKNITVISEVVAMNHLLKYSGVNSAIEFNRRLQEAMRPVRDYLEEDYE